LIGLAPDECRSCYIGQDQNFSAIKEIVRFDEMKLKFPAKKKLFDFIGRLSFEALTKSSSNFGHFA
jgi:hypothetical protein